MTTAAPATWEPPASIPKAELVSISERVLARSDVPFDVREDVFRINALGLDWDIGGEVFTPNDPSRIARGPNGRQLAFFYLHGGAGDHRTRRFYRLCVAGAFLAVVLGVVVETIDRGSGLPAWSLLALGAAVVAAQPLRDIGRASGRALIPVLVGTARLQIVFGVLLALGLWVEVLLS